MAHSARSDPGIAPILLWLPLGLLLALRLLAATRMQLLGDEAFYWLESRVPELAYSDLPGMTAWLIAIGTQWAGQSALAVRGPFLALSALLPLLVHAIAREFHGPRGAALAGLAALAIPLVGLSGLLALPDVPLTVFALLALLALVRAWSTDAWGWWLTLGLALAWGLCSHYRFAIPATGLALAVLIDAEGRRLLRRPGSWLALGVGALGLLPILLETFGGGAAATRFQLLERHPWQFQPAGLLQPAEQALVTTPLLYVALLASAACLLRRARRGSSSAGAVFVFGVFPLLFYAAAGLWADQDRTHFHWPLFAYLALAVGLPDLWAWCASRRWGRPALTLALSAGLAVSVAVPAYLVWITGHPRQPIASARLYPDNFLGWRQMADTVRRLQEAYPDLNSLAADNFMTAAQLAFELRRGPVPSLDHPLNSYHGRAAQLRRWGLDASALRPDRGTLLVVESTSLDLARRPAWFRGLCDLFASVEWLDAVDLNGGRKQFVFLAGRPQPGPCQLPAFAYLDEPLAGAEVSGMLAVRGWAFRDRLGLDAVDILIDGQLAATAHYGLDRPGVADFFAGSDDPSHPGVGFEVAIPMAGYAPGRHQLRVRTRSGPLEWLHPATPIEVVR